MNRDKTAHELFFNTFEAMFINSLPRIGLLQCSHICWPTIQQDIFGGLETVEAQLWTLW